MGRTNRTWAIVIAFVAMCGLFIGCSKPTPIPKSNYKVYENDWYLVGIETFYKQDRAFNYAQVLADKKGERVYWWVYRVHFYKNERYNIHYIKVVATDPVKKPKRAACDRPKCKCDGKSCKCKESKCTECIKP